ncbi:LysR substrate-binding domain-containing protein [Variovorax guangxiensis]|uniref:LysR family transcriptional regulator n=1 Tax=Variovorax guangxiensis TaxID=1775474 RepID=UPI0028557F4D|nr:LysR substrate-binding domain-containing protein [Variovorax guangxiensis]MDR6858707.1 DNA-binding transcriptional LysR family regulator [Variovorax guangxiensis]
MRLHGLDLNLLISLDALLQTRGVTSAAALLHVTQPTMSGSLARLREHFGDPLLMPAGRALKLSPLGQTLRTPVRDALQQVERAVALRPTFDPASDRRHFVLCASHMTLTVLGVPLTARLHRSAPGVTLEWMEAAPDHIGERLSRGDIDLAFLGEQFVRSEHPHQLVIHDNYVCIAWTGNRKVGKRLTQATYLGLGHVGTRYGPQGIPGGEQHAINALQLPRRVEVVCASPVMLGALVAGTDRLATLGAKLADRQAKELPLRVLPPPWPLPPLRIQMQWSRHREGDAALDWFRKTVTDVARQTGCIADQSLLP